MNNIKNLVGKRFGRLLVISLEDKRYRGGAVWKCRCDCGNICNVASNHLGSNKQQSCGCLRIENSIKKTRLEFGMASFNSLFAKYKRGAKKRNLCFELTEKDFMSITQNKCFYCGLDPITKHNSKGNCFGAYIYNGIDRIDSTKGYTLDNCVPCCKRCNLAKNDMSLDEFVEWLDRITTNWNYYKFRT